MGISIIKIYFFSNLGIYLHKSLPIDEYYIVYLNINNGVINEKFKKNCNWT
jgi:hypothetical protein